MPLSPTCLVADGLGPFVPTTNGVDVGPSDTIQIQLQDTSVASSWYLIILGTDETSTPPALTNVNPGTGQVISPTSIVSFTYPAGLGRSIVFQSTVYSGSTSLTTTFAIYTLTAGGKRVAAINETREGNSEFGWSAILNPIQRDGASYLYYNDAVVSPATGSSDIQGALDYIKVHLGGGGGPAGFTFVYQEGGVTAGNVYNSFAGAHIAALAVQISRPTIIVDPSLGTPIVTPGTYSIDGMTILGPTGASSSLTLQDGAQFTATNGFTIDGVSVIWTNTGVAVMPVSGALTVNLRNAVISNGGVASQPFFHVTGAGALTLYGGNLGGALGVPVVSADAGTTCDITLADERFDGLGNDSLFGDGGITVTVDFPDLTNVGQTHPGATHLTFSFATSYPPVGNTVPTRGANAEALFSYVTPGATLNGTLSITPGGQYGLGGSLDGSQLTLDVNGAGPSTLTFAGGSTSATESAMLSAIQAQWPDLLATQSGTGTLALRNAATPDGTIIVGAGSANAVFGLTPGPYRLLPSAGFVRLPSAVVSGSTLVALAIQSSVTPANSYSLFQVDTNDIVSVGETGFQAPLYLFGGATATAPADPNTNPNMVLLAFGPGTSSIQTDTTRFYVGSPWDGTATHFIVYPGGGITGLGPQNIDFDRNGSLFTVTVHGNMTLNAPSNVQPGGIYTLIVTQIGGPWTMTWNAVFHFGSAFNGTLTNTAGATDTFYFVGDAGGILRCVAASNGGGFTPGGDLTGTSSSQTVSAIQTLPTVAGSTAVNGYFARIKAISPWSDPVDVAWDGTNLWVLDGTTGEGGVVNVFKVNPGTQVITRYPLPATINQGSRIIADASHVYVGVRDNSTQHNLVVLSVSTGAVIGLGLFPSSSSALGLALDGAGFIWTSDVTNGLQGFLISGVGGLLASYPSAVSPAKTLAFSNAIDLASDGTFLYTTDGTNIRKVNPAVPAFVLSPLAVGSVNKLLYDSSAGSNIWATSGTNLVRITNALVVVATMPSSGAHTGTLGRMAFNGISNMSVAVTTGPYIEQFNTSGNFWQAEETASAQFPTTTTGGMVRANFTVWAVQTPAGVGVTIGLQSYGASFVGAVIIGINTLVYGFLDFLPTGGPGTTPYPAWRVLSDSSNANQLTAYSNGAPYFDIGQGYIGLPSPVAAPSAPGTGQLIYVDEADGILKSEDQLGNIKQLSAAPVPVGGDTGKILQVGGAGTYALVVPAPIRVYGVAQTTLTTQTGAQTACTFPFDPSAYSVSGRVIKLKAIMQVASGSDTLSLILTDITDAVVIHTFTSSSITPDYQTVTLAIGAAGVDTIPNSEKIYTLTFYRTGGSPSDSVTVHNCYLEVSY